MVDSEEMKIYLNYIGVNIKSKEIDIWHINHWHFAAIIVIFDKPKAPTTI